MTLSPFLGTLGTPFPPTWGPAPTTWWLLYRIDLFQLIQLKPPLSYIYFAHKKAFCPSTEKPSFPEIASNREQINVNEHKFTSVTRNDFNLRRKAAMIKPERTNRISLNNKSRLNGINIKNLTKNLQSVHSYIMKNATAWSKWALRKTPPPLQ